MILVASDVHLGYDRSNFGAFGSFLDKCDAADIDHLVLLGDVFDFWRMNNANIAMDPRYADIFEKLGGLKIKNVHYVVGNHDFNILRLSEKCVKSFGANVFPYAVSKSLRLEDGGSRFYFIHGYELEVLLSLKPLNIENYEQFSDYMCFNNDVTGSFASKMWDIIQKHGSAQKMADLKKAPHERETIDNIRNFAESKGIFMLLGMKPDEKLVFGHTHRPFISDDRKIANSGSWVNEHADRRLQNTYVKIIDGQMEVKIFDEDDFP
jgi:UDP-2,3-diacylglucosamine pyrophosphatase LpxH